MLLTRKFTFSTKKKEEGKKAKKKVFPFVFFPFLLSKYKKGKTKQNARRTKKGIKEASIFFLLNFF